MSVNKINYMGTDINGEFSGSVFGELGMADVLENGSASVFCDDFHLLRASAVDYEYLEADDNASIGLLTSDVGGILRLALASDDNEEANLSGTADMCGLYLDTGKGDAGFEARVRINVITGASFFVGVGTPGASAVDWLADTQTDAAIVATSNESLIGFICAADTADYADAAYQTAAGAGHTVHSNNAWALVADTWVKFGFKFKTPYIYYYVNGAQVGTALTVETSGFPDGLILSPMIALKNAANQATNLDLDWWRFSQKR